MPWKNIVGQEEAILQIRRTLQSGRLGGSYLIIGPQGVGQADMALEFAKALFCKKFQDDSCGMCEECRLVEHGSYLDLIHLRRDPESKSGDITIDQVREIIETANTMPVRADRRVSIIHEADRLTAQAAECLLKTLEEPSPTSIFILYSSSPDSLPQTIPSRCLKIRLSLAPPEKIARVIEERYPKIEKEKSRLIAQMCGGRIERAIALCEGNIAELRQAVLEALKEARERNHYQIVARAQAFGKNRQEAREWLRLFMSILRDALLIQTQADPELLSHIDCRETIHALFNTASPRQIVGYLQKAQESDAMLDGNVQPASAFENLFLALT